jgi:inosine/xanthosine triphosphatase
VHEADWGRVRTEREGYLHTIACASTNPVKIAASRLGFARMFPDETFRVDPVAVPSAVAEQPPSSGETLRGATARAAAVRTVCPDADFWIGIEGGVDEQDGVMEAFAWVVVLSPRGWGRSRSGSFPLPPAVTELVRSGVELGPADDRVFGRRDSKKKEGAIGLLTGNVVDRTALYAEAVVLALVPFKNRRLYAGSPPPPDPRS